MLHVILGFVSGIGVILVGAYVASILQRRNERLRRTEDTLFKIYMKLMELNGYYFWYTSAEIRKEKVPSDIKRKTRDLSWQISDLLRVTDDFKLLPRILTVLFDDNSIPARERYDEIKKIINELGDLINPQYSKIMKEISQRNIHKRTIGRMPDDNTPGKI